jgi:hypothetical protein
MALVEQNPQAGSARLPSMAATGFLIIHQYLLQRINYPAHPICIRGFSADTAGFSYLARIWRERGSLPQLRIGPTAQH